MPAARILGAGTLRPYSGRVGGMILAKSSLFSEKVLVLRLAQMWRIYQLWR